MTLEQHAFIFEQDLIWGDMDAFGHLNNVQFYRYFESARIAYLSQLDSFGRDSICVIAQSSCQYLSPVVYPDQLKIGVSVIEIRNSGFKMQYSMYSTQQQKVVAIGDAIIVWMNPEGTHKVTLPTSLREKIIALEATVSRHLT